MNSINCLTLIFRCRNSQHSCLELIYSQRLFILLKYLITLIFIGYFIVIGHVMPPKLYSDVLRQNRNNLSANVSGPDCQQFILRNFLLPLITFLDPSLSSTLPSLLPPLPDHPSTNTHLPSRFDIPPPPLPPYNFPPLNIPPPRQSLPYLQNHHRQSCLLPTPTPISIPKPSFNQQHINHNFPYRQPTSTHQPSNTHFKHNTTQKHSHFVPPLIFPLAKLFIQVIKCNHHIAQLNFGIPKSFKNFATNIKSSIKPAFATPVIHREISVLADSFANSLSLTLISHYQLSLNSALNILKSASLSKSDYNLLVTATRKWSSSSLGQKLSNETLTKSFDLIEKTVFFSINRLQPNSSQSIPISLDNRMPQIPSNNITPQIQPKSLKIKTPVPQNTKATAIGPLCQTISLKSPPKASNKKHVAKSNSCVLSTSKSTSPSTNNTSTPASSSSKLSSLSFISVSPVFSDKSKPTKLVPRQKRMSTYTLAFASAPKRLNKSNTPPKKQKIKSHVKNSNLLIEPSAIPNINFSTTSPFPSNSKNLNF